MRHGRADYIDLETVFDGKTLTLLGRNQNVYTQVDTPGSIDHLVDELRRKYDRPLPAADLLLTDAYDGLMAAVVDVKDLGSGVIGGTECDYLAFRTQEVDWQIWIAQGSESLPLPVRHCDQGCDRWPAVQHPDPELEDRRRGRRHRLPLQGTPRAPSASSWTSSRR